MIDIGVAQNDITPQQQVWLSGYGDRHSRSADVYQTLRAGAIYLSGAIDEIIIITADLIGYGRGFSTAAKERIAAATGLEPRQIVLTATHTHCGPHFFPMAFPGEIEVGYADFLHERLVEVAVAARASASSGEVRFSRARSSFGINRRLPDGGGGVHFAPNPDGPIDRDLDSFWFSDASGTPIGSFTIYGCHPTSLSGYSIGGDYPGFLCRSLEAATGAPSLFATGCAGDVRPQYGSDPGEFQRPDLEAVEKAGADMAADALAGRSNAVLLDCSQLRSVTHTHQLPYGPLPRSESIEASACGSDLNRHTWARAMQALDELPGSCPQEIQILQFSDAFRALFLSGEILSEIGLHLKERLAPATTVTVAYSNDLIGYVPSEATYDLGGYEVDGGSHYYFLQPAPFTRQAERLVIDRTAEMVTSLSRGAIV